MESFVSLAFEQYPEEMGKILMSNESFSTPEALLKRIEELSGGNNRHDGHEMSFDDACTLDKLHDEYTATRDKLMTTVPDDVSRILRLGKFASPDEKERALRVQSIVLTSRELLSRVPKTIEDYTSWLAEAAKLK
jgi:hypothetical protein